MILDWLRGRNHGSAATAKERLQFVLVHDRAGVSASTLEALKDEVIAAISRHVEIDREGVTVSLTKDRRRQRLVADIPLADRRSPKH